MKRQYLAPAPEILPAPEVEPAPLVLPSGAVEPAGAIVPAGLISPAPLIAPAPAILPADAITEKERASPGPKGESAAKRPLPFAPGPFEVRFTESGICAILHPANCINLKTTINTAMWP